MATTTTLVGSGRYTYEVHDDWAKLPDGWEMPAAGVTVDAHDRVYCFNRTPDHPVVVFDRDGNYLSSWGAGLFAFPHTIRVDHRDNLWLVDRDHGQIPISLRGASPGRAPGSSTFPTGSGSTGTGASWCVIERTTACRSSISEALSFTSGRRV
jgi:hypothetical protein